MPKIEVLSSPHKMITSANQSKADPFYTSTTWRKVRLIKKRRNPLCEPCLKKNILTKTHSIDHHKPRRLWPELRLTLENLISMCKSCHSKKTAKERRCKTKDDWYLMFDR